jgi:hypothetical protein
MWQNNIRMKLNYLIFFSIFIAAGCSTDNEYQQKISPTFSSSTLNEFESIENGNGINNNDQLQNTISTNSKKYNNEAIQIKKNGNPEIVNELIQNMAYFCMKNGEGKIFPKGQKCADYVKNSLSECESKIIKINRDLLNCVKKNLGLW